MQALRQCLERTPRAISLDSPYLDDRPPKADVEEQECIRQFGSISIVVDSLSPLTATIQRVSLAASLVGKLSHFYLQPVFEKESRFGPKAASTGCYEIKINTWSLYRGSLKSLPKDQEELILAEIFKSMDQKVEFRG